MPQNYKIPHIPLFKILFTKGLKKNHMFFGHTEGCKCQFLIYALVNHHKIRLEMSNNYGGFNYNENYLYTTENGGYHCQFYRLFSWIC